MSTLDRKGTCDKCGLDYAAQLGFRPCRCMAVHKPAVSKSLTPEETTALALKYLKRATEAERLNKIMYDALDSIAHGNVLTGAGKRYHTWKFSDMRDRAKVALKQVDEGK